MASPPPTTINDLSVKPLWSEWGADGISTQGTAKATSKMTYVVPWEDRWTFIQEINGIFGGVASRLPMQAEDAPLLLVSATGESKGFGAGDKIPNFRPGISPYVFNPKPFKYARVPVLFSTPDYQVTGDEALLQVDLDMSGEIVSLPFGYYTLDGIPGTQGIGKYVPNTNLTITRFRVAEFDRSQLNDLRGKVNQDVFFDCDPGTVMFNGVRSSETKDFGGVILRTISYAFSWKREKWNQGVSPLTGEMVDYQPQPIYEEASLNDLFTTPAPDPGGN